MDLTGLYMHMDIFKLNYMYAPEITDLRVCLDKQKIKLNLDKNIPGLTRKNNSLYTGLGT